MLSFFPKDKGVRHSLAILWPKHACDNKGRKQRYAGIVVFVALQFHATQLAPRSSCANRTMPWTQRSEWLV
eukprot:SAG11_NODE_2527_length_3253_cov_1.733756_2_plen_71_part_00